MNPADLLSTLQELNSKMQRGSQNYGGSSFGPGNFEQEKQAAMLRSLLGQQNNNSGPRVRFADQDRFAHFFSPGMGAGDRRVSLVCFGGVAFKPLADLALLPLTRQANARSVEEALMAAFAAQGDHQGGDSFSTDWTADLYPEERAEPKKPAPDEPEFAWTGAG